MGYIRTDPDYFRSNNVFEEVSYRDRFQYQVMIHPKYFDVHYEINPYMGGQVNVELATQQWEALRDILAEAYAVQVIDPDRLYELGNLSTPPGEIPDYVFSANQWTPLSHKDSTVYLTRFKHEERQAEEEYTKTFLESQDIPYVEPPAEYTFEAQGDFLWQPNHTIVWAGHGIRTDREVVEHFAKHTPDEILIVPIQLNTTKHYHLDTCFRPINEDVAIAIPDAMTSPSFSRIDSTFDTVIELPQKDFGANSFVIDDPTIITPQSSTVWKPLNELGFDVTRIPYGEFMKGGGSIACTVVPLNQ